MQPIDSKATRTANGFLGFAKRLRDPMKHNVQYFDSHHCAICAGVCGLEAEHESILNVDTRVVSDKDNYCNDCLFAEAISAMFDPADTMFRSLCIRSTAYKYVENAFRDARRATTGGDAYGYDEMTQEMADLPGFSRIRNRIADLCETTAKNILAGDNDHEAVQDIKDLERHFQLDVEERTKGLDMPSDGGTVAADGVKPSHEDDQS